MTSAIRSSGLLAALVLMLVACSGSSTASPSGGTSGPDDPPRTQAPASVEPSMAPPSRSAKAEDGAFEVTVNGLAVRGHCTGDREPGEPVVILQSGNGGGEDDLSGIEEHMAADAMVCAFARPGAGENGAPPDLPRPVDDVVQEVHDILAMAEVPAPYFLIGQSGGAVVTFMFAQAYPDEVAGFVSMNGNPPFDTWVAAAEAIGLPEIPLGDAVADFSGRNPEQIDFRSNESMLTDPLPASMPYAVIYDECGGAPGCDDSWEAAVVEQLAEVGEGGRFVRATGAGHDAFRTQPELVHATIDEVWAEATD
jgi:pimeloyl-ACP methyl ester carboxylesterase